MPGDGSPPQQDKFKDNKAMTAEKYDIPIHDLIQREEDESIRDQMRSFEDILKKKGRTEDELRPVFLQHVRTFAHLPTKDRLKRWQTITTKLDQGSTIQQVNEAKKHARQRAERYKDFVTNYFCSKISCAQASRILNLNQTRNGPRGPQHPEVKALDTTLQEEFFKMYPEYALDVEGFIYWRVGSNLTTIKMLAKSAKSTLFAGSELDCLAAAATQELGRLKPQGGQPTTTMLHTIDSAVSVASSLAESTPSVQTAACGDDASHASLTCTKAFACASEESKRLVIAVLRPIRTSARDVLFKFYESPSPRVVFMIVVTFFGLTDINGLTLRLSSEYIKEKKVETEHVSCNILHYWAKRFV